LNKLKNEPIGQEMFMHPLWPIRKKMA